MIEFIDMLAAFCLVALVALLAMLAGAHLIIYLIERFLL